uniref:Uncharacterized protein n=1 Tax=Schistosoma haematobium TaxID=6185 RepID=A0A094ZYT0_SCHHA
MFSFIWNEKFWLPHNVTWDLMKEINSAGVSPTLTKSMDCFYAVAVLTAIRYYLKKYVGLQFQFFISRSVLIPHGLSMGLRFPKISHVPDIPALKTVLTPEIHWYYMVQLGYYTASLLWIFYEVKRSHNTLGMKIFTDAILNVGPS